MICQTPVFESNGSSGLDYRNVVSDYVSFWTLSNDATEETGNYNGTPEGSLAFTGHSGLFNTTDYIIIPDIIPDIFTGDVDFSFTVWVKGYTLNSTGGDTVFTATRTRSLILTFAELDIGSTNFGFRTCMKGGWINACTGPSFNTNQWYSVCYTYNASSGITMYINGASYLTTSNHGSISTHTGDSYIGHYTNRPFDGEISKIRLYNRVITAQEVSDIYNAEKGDFGL